MNGVQYVSYVLYFPSETDIDILQALITKCALDYATFCKPHIGKSATSADKAGRYVERPGEVSGELHVVKGWFAIRQEVYTPFNL